MIQAPIVRKAKSFFMYALLGCVTLFTSKLFCCAILFFVNNLARDRYSDKDELVCFFEMLLSKLRLEH